MDRLGRARIIFGFGLAAALAATAPGCHTPRSNVPPPLGFSGQSRMPDIGISGRPGMMPEAPNSYYPGVQTQGGMTGSTATGGAAYPSSGAGGQFPGMMPGSAGMSSMNAGPGAGTPPIPSNAPPAR